MSGTPTAAPSEAAAGIEQLVDTIRRLPASCGETVVVAIDGPSCAGKTQFAQRLGDSLGATVVHMDDLYAGWDGLAGAVHGVVDQVLVPLSALMPARHQRWDWENDTWHDAPVQVPATEVIIVEGVGSASKVSAPYVALSVWLEAPAQERFERAMARDESFRAYWERWAEQELEYFRADSPKQRADVVIDTSAR